RSGSEAGTPAAAAGNPAADAAWRRARAAPGAPHGVRAEPAPRRPRTALPRRPCLPPPRRASSLTGSACAGSRRPATRAAATHRRRARGERGPRCSASSSPTAGQTRRKESSSLVSKRCLPIRGDVERAASGGPGRRSSAMTETTTSLASAAQATQHGACTPQGRITRSLLGYGVLAGPFYIGVSLAQALVRDGFDLTRHEWSLLANGPGGWIQVLN